MLIEKSEKFCIKHIKHLEVFGEFSNDIKDASKDICYRYKIKCFTCFHQLYFAVPKNIRLISFVFSICFIIINFIIKIPNKGERQQVALNHLLDIDYFLKLYRKGIKGSYYVLAIHTTLTSDHS